MKKPNRNDPCTCGSGKKHKNCCGQKTKEQLFWEWFSEKSAQYLNFENDQKRLFEELGKELQAVDDNLSFEFSPALSNGKREFVITAQGIKKSFPAVTKLVTAAPSFPNWIIIAFRQPHLDYTRIEYLNIQFDFDDVFFLYGKSNGKVDLDLHIRGYQGAYGWKEAISLLLDKIIGEYNTEMKIGGISIKKLNVSDIPNLYPITELAKIIS